MRMNSVQLKNHLLKMASYQNKFTPDFCETVINVIINYYMKATNYFEQHAIKTFTNFLESGCIVW